MKHLIESGEAIEVILSSFVEAENTSHSWQVIEGCRNVMYKLLSISPTTRDVVNFYDQRRIQILSKRNRLQITQIQAVSLKTNYRRFQARTGLTLVIVPCATNLCIEFAQQGLKTNHCFSGTKSVVVVIGDDIEFKLAGSEPWNDFATVISC